MSVMPSVKAPTALLRLIKISDTPTLIQNRIKSNAKTLYLTNCYCKDSEGTYTIEMSQQIITDNISLELPM